MATDPRATFFVAKCAKGQKIQQSATAEKKDFFSALGKVGDLELLNDVGFGKVGEGLRVLAATSDSIRTGVVSPTILGSDANAESTVYDAVGIDSGAAQTASSFNPGVANRASAQAKAIFEKVKQGEFELSDIPETFSDLQNLSTLIDGIFTNRTPEAREFELCGASPYAMDLISYAPKYKFLFVVEFEYTTPYREFRDTKVAFVVKNSTRPNITFEYDDVNMYNFWTKVPKRTVYEPMTMRFYDDNQNQAMSLYNSYLRAMSPIANIDFGNMAGISGAIESASMDFSQLGKSSATAGVLTHSYAASLGPTIDQETKNIFNRIKLYHVYREGRSMNIYHFFNPKIVSMELDDLDMADNGNGNEISFQFAYDSMYIQTGQSVADYKENLKTLTSGGIYPLTYIGEETAKVTDPGQVPDGTRSLFEQATSSLSGAINSASNIVSNAFNSANEYLGSKFL